MKQNFKLRTNETSGKGKNFNIWKMHGLSILGCSMSVGILFMIMSAFMLVCRSVHYLKGKSASARNTLIRLISKLGNLLLFDEKLPIKHFCIDKEKIYCFHINVCVFPDVYKVRVTFGRTYLAKISFEKFYFQNDTRLL